MQYSNKSALKKPIINSVVYLNKQLCFYGRQLPQGKKRKGANGTENMAVDIRKCYFYPILEKAGVLFVYAMRQLKGKDYLKRSMELVEEIQAQCYLIMEMRGWNTRVCAELDIICDDIAEQLQAISHHAKVDKPMGEGQ